MICGTIDAATVWLIAGLSGGICLAFGMFIAGNSRTRGEQ